MYEPLARSAQVGQARALLMRAVDVISESKKKTGSSHGLVAQARGHVVWSEDLLGMSRDLIDRLRESVTHIATGDVAQRPRDGCRCDPARAGGGPLLD